YAAVCSFGRRRRGSGGGRLRPTTSAEDTGGRAVTDPPTGVRALRCSDTGGRAVTDPPTGVRALRCSDTGGRAVTDPPTGVRALRCSDTGGRAVTDPPTGSSCTQVLAGDPLVIPDGDLPTGSPIVVVVEEPAAESAAGVGRLLGLGLRLLRLGFRLLRCEPVEPDLAELFRGGGRHVPQRRQRPRGLPVQVARREVLDDLAPGQLAAFQALEHRLPRIGTRVPGDVETEPLDILVGDRLVLLVP